MMGSDADRPDSAVVVGAKLIVRIMARRKRATTEAELLTIFEREGGGGSAEFKAALAHALNVVWVRYRDANRRVLAGGPSRDGLKAAGLIP